LSYRGRSSLLEQQRKTDVAEKDSTCAPIINHDDATFTFSHEKSFAIRVFLFLGLTSSPWHWLCSLMT
jgi:hypothetical protein